jgi:hypothetical protein
MVFCKGSGMEKRAMKFTGYAKVAGGLCCLIVFCTGVVLAAGADSAQNQFPRSLDSYADARADGLLTVLEKRVAAEPFNLVATLIFICAIVHTFLSSRFMALAHKWERAHEQRIRNGQASKYAVHYGAELFHFLGEVEVIFGLWSIVLIASISGFYGWGTVVHYLGYRVNFTEALFVVVIMTLAATRPILRLSETIMQKIADLLGGGLTAWWFTVLTFGPLLGSFITEPAAMTISALLLARKFYTLKPGVRFRYATLGLLFVNISVGGTLTHFAAPPVLMVSAPWNWGTVHMLTHFGWKAIIGILAGNGLYYLFFRQELARLQHDFAVQVLKDKIQTRLVKRRELEAEFEKIGPAASRELGFEETIGHHVAKITERIKARLEAEYLPDILGKGCEPDLIREAFEKRFDEIKTQKMRQLIPGLLPEEQRPRYVDPAWDQRDDPVPAWVTVVHVVFMGWTIFNAHYPQLFIPGLLFFLGFAQVTSPFQNRIDLKPALLVGFFLGGLVVHGGVQGWWIEPVLGKLSEIPLMVGATVLTAFNDNAAITFLSTLVPTFTDSLKYSVVAGAVAGGGLTVIANAPNPAGQSILKKFFDNGVSPAGLLAGSLLPTFLTWLCFLVFR